MPTYQYACTTCGEQIEVVQRFTDDPLTVCPACGNGLRKVFSPVGIVFKGSGFYRTDSRNGSVAKGDKDKEPKTAAKPDRPGDGTPPGKPEKKASSDGASSSETGKPAGQQAAHPASAAASS